MPEIASEHREQIDFFQKSRVLFERWPLLRDLLFAIPNGGHRHKLVGLRMRAEGQKSGVPDICCAIPSGSFHGLWIEMKRRKGGSLSKNQKDIIAKLREQGYAVRVCKGADEAFSVLAAYLEGKCLENPN